MNLRGGWADECGMAQQSDTKTPTPTRRALVIDDCSLSRMLAERSLCKAGYTVVAAESGMIALQALEKCREGSGLARFDIVVIDVNMPGMSGPEIVREIRARGCMVPVIACSGSREVDIRKRCIDAGCHSFVTKPFRPATIVEACDNALKKAA